MTAPTISARPTTYNGIKMRSRLEARYAAWLDEQRATWEYEPQCFASDHGQYLPDFVVHNVEFHNGTADVYVEVKPKPLTQAEGEDLLERQLSIWQSEPTALILIDVASVRRPHLRVNWSTGVAGYEAVWTRNGNGALALFVPITRSWTEH